MVVILHTKVTGSAEIVVTAGSSSDPHVVIADLLGFTVGDALKRLFKKGYKIKFVSGKRFVCIK